MEEHRVKKQASSDAVLRLIPATMLRIGTYSEPPPTPPALETAAARKERMHARMVPRLLCKEDPIPVSCELQ